MPATVNLVTAAVITTLKQNSLLLLCQLNPLLNTYICAHRLVLLAAFVRETL